MEIENYKYCRNIGNIGKPFSIISKTNSVDVTFISTRVSYGYRYKGFVAVWSQLENPTGCNSCDFPFTFGAVTFDTCISVMDVDTQPWCSYNTTAPVLTPVKIPCTVGWCPSKPPQTVITSPNYPQDYYSNIVDKVE